jgi:hypothetical protein
MTSVPLPKGFEARIDTPLQELLVELASVLLPCGVTPKAFAGFAKYAFAQAAARTSKLGNGKINRSRVAAKTGLSRAEVSSMLRRGFVVSSRVDESPLHKVIRGWGTDRRFTRSRGGPKHLKMSNARGSFRHLVKCYAGDIPYRAVLDELVLIGAVVIRKENVELQMANLEGVQNDYRFLVPALRMLVDALRQSGSSSTPVKVWRLTSRVDSDIEDVRDTYKKLAERLIRMPHKGRRSRTRTHKGSACYLTISIVQSKRD